MTPLSLAMLALRYWWVAAITGLVVLLYVQNAALDSTRASLHASRLETARETARARAWEASYRQADALRREEQGRALRAVSEADAMCEARVSKARKSANAIQTIIQKVPTYDPNGCPVRSVIGSRELSDALAPR
jgi:hypothetical protein